MEQSPKLVPGFVDMAEFNKDRALRVPLSEIELYLLSLSQAVTDSNILVGSEIYSSELAFYQNTRQAAKRGIDDAQVIYDDLKTRFPGSNPQPAVPPTPPAKP